MTTDTSADILKNKGMKITKARLFILDIIKSFNTPFSVKMIVSEANNVIDQATIYRFVNYLCKFGLIREIVTLDLEVFYEYVHTTRPCHSHFICRECHKIICFHDSGINSNVMKKDGMTIDSIVYLGYCIECSDDE